MVDQIRRKILKTERRRSAAMAAAKGVFAQQAGRGAAAAAGHFVEKGPVQHPLPGVGLGLPAAAHRRRRPRRLDDPRADQSVRRGG